MRNLRTAVLVLLSGGMIAGCTGGGVFGTNNTVVGNPVFNPTNAVLQLSVGTVNDNFGSWRFLLSSGTSITTVGTYLNAVATFRAPNGLSAFPNPGPATLVDQTSVSTTISFIDSGGILRGGIFAYGQSGAFNGVGGLPPTYPSAGAPATGFDTGFLVSSGRGRIVGHPTGMYTLTVTPSQNGVSTPFTATAMLHDTTHVLANWASAPVWTADGSHDGGGTFTLPAFPAGVTEALIVVWSTNGSCGFARVATVETMTTTATLPPGTLSALCPDFLTTAFYRAIAIGADYPLVENGPPTNTQQTPALGGLFFGNSDLVFSQRTSSTGFQP